MITNRALTYEFRVQGNLDDHWSTSLGGLTVARHDDGTSTLSGPVADQSQLHRVLAKLGDIGTTLLSLCAVEPTVTRDETAEDRVRPPVLEQPVRTERLTLRPATPQDAENTFRYRRSESVGRWLTEIPTDLERYRARFTDPVRLASAVVVELEGRTIGDFMLRVEDAWAQAEVADRARDTQAELGWVLDPAYTGHGYATEAVRGLLRVCFESLGVRRVVANCFLDNDASWRLMERVGMRREMHAVRDALHRSGRWLDSATYAILSDEWASSTTDTPGLTRPDESQ
jgi:RimJ/RimL family protein N-acetyltransferase